MTHFTRITASSIALIFALFGSANAQDSTFDVEAETPKVKNELLDMEADLRDFFDEDETVEPLDPYDASPSLNAREESELLKRAEQEQQEFNDIDNDDLATLSRDDKVRLEKPGQIEKDAPITCPLGQESGPDGACKAPD